MGFVEGDVGDVFLRGGEVDGGLGGRVVAPGDYGVEVGDEGLREAGGEGFAAELGGEAGGEVLKHDEGDEEAVARGPGGGLIAEEAELEGEVGALEFDGGVDAGGVALEEVELIGGEGGDGAVGGGADEEGALEAVVSEKPGPRISARVPEAWRRRESICQRRSCAVTKPWARRRSSSEAARMWGTPWASRWMVTGAERPGMETAPSSWGRESCMDWRSQWRAVTKPMTAKRMTSDGEDDGDAAGDGGVWPGARPLAG